MGLVRPLWASLPRCSVNQAADLQTALLNAITGLTQLLSQLSSQFPISQTAIPAAEPWVDEQGATGAKTRSPRCVPNQGSLEVTQNSVPEAVLASPAVPEAP